MWQVKVKSPVLSKNPVLKISIVLALVTLGGFGCASTALAQISLPKTSAILEFSRSLSLGIRGNDVRALQEFLAKDPKIYPNGLITGFFGPQTREAVKKWQRKNGLPAVGVVGPKTIAKLKETTRVMIPETTAAPTPQPNPESTATTSVPTVPDDTVPPQVTLDLRAAAPTNIYIEFNPSEEVIAVYEYGLTTNYGLIREVWNQYFSSPTGIYLEDLTPATTYHVRAKVTDRTGNIGYSANYTFTTPSLDQAAVISSGPVVSASNAKPSTAITINWTTNIPCTGTLYYGADGTFGNAKNSGHTTDHTATITGLAPGASYLYKITCATAKKTVESSNFSFTATSSASSTTLNPALASILQTLNEIIQKVEVLIKR